MKKIVCMFPGQGSQKEGMGIDLFDSFPNLVDQANNLLGYSIQELCINNPENKLNQTQYTQPILFVINALSYFRFFGQRGTPDFVIGHSLGEFNALLAAEMFDFETGLKIVKKRGELMGEVQNGGMASVTGLSLSEVSSIIDEKYPELDIANINSHNQIVVSGSKQVIEKARETFEDEYAEYTILRVSGAFHSRYMRPIQEKFANFLKQFDFAPPKLEVISNLEASPYSHEKISYLLENQISHPVLWNSSIEYLLQKNSCDFIQLGSGRVLINLLEKIQKQFMAAN